MTVVSKYNAISNFFGEIHFVGHQYHRSSLNSQFLDNSEYLTNKFWIKRRSNFVKQQDLRFHGNSASYANSLLLAA